MAHEILAFVGPVDTLKSMNQSPEGGRIFLPQHGSRIGVLPIDFFDEENVPGWYGRRMEIGQKRITFFPSDDAFAKHCSMGSALVYIETEYRFDEGYEAAAVWIDGERVYGPVTEWMEDSPTTNAVSLAIDQLGSATGLVDEAKMLGLGAIRSNYQFVMKWVELGATPEPSLIPEAPEVPDSEASFEPNGSEQRLPAIVAVGWLGSVKHWLGFR